MKAFEDKLDFLIQEAQKEINRLSEERLKLIHHLQGLYDAKHAYEAAKEKEANK